jgi:hypothetical protein
MLTQLRHKAIMLFGNEDGEELTIDESESQSPAPQHNPHRTPPAAASAPPSLWARVKKILGF